MRTTPSSPARPAPAPPRTLAPVSDRERLEARLRAAGLTDEEIAAAEKDGRLATIAVELTLGGLAAHTLTEVATAANLPTAFLRELLQAAGRPNPQRGQRVFTDEDIEMARLVRMILDFGLERQDILEVARVLGQGTALMAESVRRIAGDALLQKGDTEEAVGLRFAQAAEQLGPAVPALLGYGFRTQLRDRIAAHMLSETELAEGRLRKTQDVAVAFADLVNYTKLGQELDPEDIGKLAGRLARLATKAQKGQTRLIKTIGDAAMFVGPDPREVVATALALRDRIDKDIKLPGARIGIAYGPATTHGGDWFGTTVNVASRITRVAKPGQILVDDDVCEKAAGFTFKKRRKRNLKGLDGRTRLHSLEPADGHTP